MKDIVFTGNFWDFFFKSLLLWIATVITFGLILPYAIYWHMKYFFTHLKIK